MPFLFMICFILGFVESLDGPHICESKTRGKYCCSYFQEKNGKCVACEVGFISRFGSPCLPCNQNSYGERCIHKCKCSKDDRCDNVVGCVQKLHSTTQSIEQSSVNLPSSIAQSVSGTSEMQRLDTGANDESDLSKEQIHIVYSASVAGFIILLVMCYIGHKCRKKSSRKETLKQENISLNNFSSSVHEYFEPNVNHYDIINDNVMIREDQSANPYLDVIISSNSSETTSKSNNSSDVKIVDSTGYLNPYQALTDKDNSTVHVYNSNVSYCKNINETFKSSVNTHSYQTLADGFIEERNMYNTLSNVHKMTLNSRLHKSEVSVFSQPKDLLASTDIDNIRRFSL
ncbi:uncharacterized protein LOC127704707 [Mytilus californianus]|uniref:uncharacterized protein LOC127704707 n=1 Tax=Mytilus californianus TaxID=6549 RepID=UPI0022478394|nr:uncharacterized protein LOC127704707 [Mytilus californianus]